MKIALIGYGAMNRLIAELAVRENHEIGLVWTSREARQAAASSSAAGPDDLAAALAGHTVAIDFSVGDQVLSHIRTCARAGVPLVEGTTGWQDQEMEARRTVEQAGGALLYGANFSIGVNLFYRIVARAAELISNFKAYDPFIEEAHHNRKRDAPSGTALKLRDVLARSLDREVEVASTRAGHIPGTHRVGFDSVADQILLTHTARTREGFAAGALWAAGWITAAGRRGVYEFSEVIDDALNRGEVGSRR